MKSNDQSCPSGKAIYSLMVRATLAIGHEIRSELASATALDVIVSFVKWTGVRVIRPELEDFARRHPGQLRVLTTTYMGATEIEALDALVELGAQVRVSYDARRTRLHAKAWLFHRDTGYSTGTLMEYLRGRIA